LVSFTVAVFHNLFTQASDFDPEQGIVDQDGNRDRDFFAEVLKIQGTGIID
jgi:hypothetical protein